MLKLLNFSCSRCLFPSDHSDHFLVNINTFDRECFCEGAEVFLDLCRDAAHAAELHQWSQREYELLSAARGIAMVWKQSGGVIELSAPPPHQLG